MTSLHLRFARSFCRKLVESTLVPEPFLSLVEGILQMWRVMYHPALEGAVMDLESSFLHDLFEIAIAQ